MSFYSWDRFRSMVKVHRHQNASIPRDRPYAKAPTPTWSPEIMLGGGGPTNNKVNLCVEVIVQDATSVRLKPKAAKRSQKHQIFWYPSIETCSHIFMIPGGYYSGEEKNRKLAYRKWWFMPAGGNIPNFFFCKMAHKQTEVERALLPSHITLRKFCIVCKWWKKERACTLHYEDKIGIC